MVSRHQHWPILFSLAAMFLGAAAFARTLTNTVASAGATIPYQGFLESSGVPLQGPVDLAFSLHDAATAGNPVWGPEVHAGVIVAAGQFSVNLGDTLDLPASALAGSRWLAISVAGTDLEGRQLLGSSPYARRGAPGQDFHVDADLAVVGNSSVAGGASVAGDSTVGGKVQVSGTVQAAAGFGYVPVGTIMAWHKTLAGTPALPPGWAECNGQTVSSVDSPYNGQALPNLNGASRFLRGGAVSGTLQDATEIYSGVTYGHNVSIRNDDGTTLAASDIFQSNNNGNYNVPWARVRPVNMSVVWIIRVQ
jgi:hypothetical protein